jgi:hypothetical protein
MSAVTSSEISTSAFISDVYRIVSAAEQRADVDKRTPIQDVGFQLEFDAHNKLIRLTANGEVSDQFLIEGITALTKCHAQYGSCDCIVDYNGATEITVTPLGLRQLAGTAPIFPMDCLTVHVAARDVMYGLARMFQILSSETRPNLRVVRNMDEALELIGVKSPTFVPIDLD